MVSGSRKKSKGRDRKAKKMETERAKAHNIWSNWATGVDKVTGKTITCKCQHGLVTLPNEDHTLSMFLNEFITYRDANNNTAYTTVEMMRATFKHHPQVWNNESYKQMAINILTSMGTNSLFLKDTGNESFKNTVRALRIAKTIYVLEHHNGTSNLEAIINSRKVQIKLRDLDMSVSSGRRDALKFFSKRITCSCLNQPHQKARRTQPKMGKCMGCGNEMERVVLSVCSRCMITQYCSRECQVADWSEHEKECHVYVHAHKQRAQIVDEKDKETRE